MAEERTPRSADGRKEEERTPDTWVPPSILPEPTPQEGMTFRWIRTSAFGHQDNTNVSQKFRTGWVPVKRDDHPELMVQSDINSQFEGNVEIGGLLLCKMPTEKVKARQRYYDEQAHRQMESVDQSFLRENDPRMPLLKPERKSRTSFSRD